jgi:error-prone DNA polymerase
LQEGEQAEVEILEKKNIAQQQVDAEGVEGVEGVEIITGDIADIIFDKMQAFANYGFPESHSVSFAYLVYSSAYIKYHEPAIFCAALLNAVIRLATPVEYALYDAYRTQAENVNVRLY